MAQVIAKTQTDAYIDFVAKYPDIKIGQRTFDKLKPFFVRPASEKDRNTCCRYHIESNLLFKSCMKFRKSKNQSETSEVESYPVYENLGEIIDVALCPKVNGSYKKCCLDRKCTECGAGKLKFSMDETEKISSAADVEWQRYEYVNENPKGTATKRRLTLVKKVTKVGEMFDYFKTLLETFPAHQHRANWQSTQMESLIQNLPPKHCICIHDYSENYHCVEKNEIQSNYFQRTECSLCNNNTQTCDFRI